MLETAVLLVTMRFGVMAIMLGLLFNGFASVAINAWPNKKLLAYSIPQQLKDTFPALALSLLMGAAILPVTWTGLPDLVKLIIMVPAGVAVYVGGSVLFKLDSFRYIWEIVWKLLHRGKETDS